MQAKQSELAVESFFHIYIRDLKQHEISETIDFLSMAFRTKSVSFYNKIDFRDEIALWLVISQKIERYELKTSTEFVDMLYNCRIEIWAR